MHAVKPNFLGFKTYRLKPIFLGSDAALKVKKIMIFLIKSNPNRF
jgi:hypothetical protein